MKFLLGLLAGFGLGLAVGLLLAPQSGRDTMARIGEQGMMLRNRSGNLADDLRSRANDLADTVRSRAGDAIAQGRETYSRTRDELTDRYSKAKTGQQL